MGLGCIADQGSFLVLEERRLYVLVSQRPKVENLQQEGFCKAVEV